MPEQTTAIAITNQFPENKFNLLVPVQTMQEISPLHRVVINQVHISSNLSDKDVYKQGNELALTKKGLEKLMTASNIQIVESVPITPKICRKCIEVAKATQIAPKCGECKAKNDVAYRVTVSIPDPSGEPRYVQASKNSKLEDAKSATEKQFLDEQCETKALNRALRKAMMIKSTYTADELKKPFVVAYVVPNMADEDMKKAMIAKYTESSSLLFKKNQDNKMLQAPKNIEIIPDDEDEGVNADDEQDVSGVGVEIDDNQKPTDIACEKCGQVIVDFNEEWPVKKLVEYSKKHFKGHVLCAECQHEASEAAKAKKAKEVGK